MNVAILISGGGSNMVRLVEAMQNGAIDATPALVLCNDSAARGLDRARELNVPVSVVDHREYTTREAFDAALDTELRAANADIVCLAGFMRILTKTFIDGWHGRILNIHPSLLPAFKGLNTHARALKAGCTIHGCSVHLVTRELDDGPILGQAVVAVGSDDTPSTLAARVLQREHQLYPACLAEFIAGQNSNIAFGVEQT